MTVNAAEAEVLRQAVARFLAGELRFLEIAAACEAVLENHAFDASPTLEQLMQLDTWARQEVLRWISR